MAVEPNMQKNMKNDLIHTNHRQGEKSEIKILARESSIVREILFELEIERTLFHCRPF